jgi:integrase/recombinase XerD
MAAHDFRNRSILKSLYWLGLRRQELTELDIRDINFERKRVTVRQGKGGKTRIVPIINDELLSDLKHLTAGRKSVPVFMSNQGKGLSL